MRATRPLTERVVSSPVRHDRTWLTGVPHIVACCASGLVFGAPACLAGLVLAALAGFVVYLPLTTLALNHGRPLGADEAAPDLSLGAQAGLLVLVAATAWVGAWGAALTH